MENVFDRFVIGDPEDILLFGGSVLSVYRVMRIGVSAAPPKQL
jgi:hypothetical protein